MMDKLTAELGVSSSAVHSVDSQRQQQRQSMQHLMHNSRDEQEEPETSSSDDSGRTFPEEVSYGEFPFMSMFGSSHVDLGLTDEQMLMLNRYATLLAQRRASRASSRGGRGQRGTRGRSRPARAVYRYTSGYSDGEDQHPGYPSGIRDPQIHSDVFLYQIASVPQALIESQGTSHQAVGDVHRPIPQNVSASSPAPNTVRSSNMHQNQQETNSSSPAQPLTSGETVTAPQSETVYSLIQNSGYTSQAAVRFDAERVPRTPSRGSSHRGSRNRSPSLSPNSNQASSPETSHSTPRGRATQRGRARGRASPIRRPFVTAFTAAFGDEPLGVAQSISDGGEDSPIIIE